VRGENPFAVDPARWIRSLTEQFDIEEDHEDFLEAVKLEMYQDQVFCFTPKGDVVKLPRGATPIDFAYAIHTRIGNACVGAKIDHMRVPLWTRIKNGQSVEIITAHGQMPQATWLEVATTGKAKSAIRRALRELDHERFVKLGFELARAAFEHVGKKPSDKVLDTAAKQLRLDGRETLLARLGSAELNASEVVQAVFPELSSDDKDAVSAERAVIGLEVGQSFQRAPCCQPLPGERIIGIKSRGRGVVVHTIDCENLTHYENQPDRWLDLHWQLGKHQPIHEVTLDLTIGNDAGVLGRICSLIGEQKANISDLTFIDRKPDFYRLLIDVELRDVEHLHSLMLALQAEGEVADIKRHRDPSRASVPAPKV
jgi:GTP pyrophosphokinase/guanosine-3',5'-bis(diphosphate) 3'-pyrophosphohydrolase